MKTPNEARACWCPFARVHVGRVNEVPLAGCNRLQTDDESLVWTKSLCIAEECMAFRWIPDVKLPLKSGETVVVDQGDADLLKGLWFDGSYMKSNEDRLHRSIVRRALGEIPSDMFVDHIDGNPFNNRRGNLRVVTKAQNAANSAARGGKSRYRGIYQQQSGRWSAQVSRAGVRMCLGTYDTEEQAAAAYDEAAKKVHGEFARLNLEPITNSGRKGYCGLAGKP